MFYKYPSKSIGSLVHSVADPPKGIRGVYGAVYAVSNRVYKKRHNKVIKKLLVDSIFDPQINFGE